VLAEENRTKWPVFLRAGAGGSAPPRLKIYHGDKDERGMKMPKVVSITKPAGRLSELAQEFLDDLARRGFSAHTVKSYRCALRALAEALNDPDASEVSQADLARFLAWDGWSAETRAAKQAALKAFFGWLSDSGRLPRDPAAGLRGVKRPEPAPRPIPESDLEKILRAADTLPLGSRCLFRLLADTGMRAGEALGLDAEDVVWDKGQESVVVRRGKGGRGRVVPIMPDMACFALLKRLCRERRRGPLFVTNRGARADYDWAYYWWQKCLERAGLADRGYTIHQLRHTRITEWVRSGVNLLAVRRAAGHRSLRTTERYAQVCAEDVRKEIERVRKGV